MHSVTDPLPDLGTVTPSPSPSLEQRPRLRRRAPSLLAPGLLFLAAAVVLGRAAASFDLTYALSWGRDLTRLEIPAYATQFSPTPHPLATALGGVASLLGPAAGPMALWLLTCVAYAAAIWLVYLIGVQVASGWAGALGAGIMATSFNLQATTTAAATDVWALALVLLAALLVARTPRSGAPPLLALAVAGLHRPEAWILAGCYWLWLAPREPGWRRVRLALLGAAAPVVWAAADLAITGDPLFSFHTTRTANAAGQAPPTLLSEGDHDRRALSITELPQTAQALGYSLRHMLQLPMVFGGVLGAVLAGLFCPRRVAVPATLGLLSALTFVALALAGLPVSDRFLFPLAVALALFYGYAAFGWLGVGPSMRQRRLWVVGGCLLALAAVASTPWRARSTEHARDLAQRSADIERDLRVMLTDDLVRRRLQACRVVYTGNYRAKPYVAYFLDRPLDDVVAANANRPGAGAFVAAANSAVSAAFLEVGAGRLRRPVPPPGGFRPVATNRSWVVLVRGC